MSEQIKLPEDLLKEIETVRNEITENVVLIGRLNVQKAFYQRDLKMIEAQLESHYDKSELLNQKEDELQKKVVSQFGNGKLDFASGIFTKD